MLLDSTLMTISLQLGRSTRSDGDPSWLIRLAGDEYTGRDGKCKRSYEALVR